MVGSITVAEIFVCVLANFSGFSVRVVAMNSDAEMTGIECPPIPLPDSAGRKMKPSKLYFLPRA